MDGMAARTLFRPSTPVERYPVRGRTVFVKRDDLYGLPPAPPLGKLRGLRLALARHYEEGVRLVGCWDTRISSLGQGLAAAVQEFDGLEAIVSYPTKKGTKMPSAIRVACALGAEVYPVPGARISICFSRARDYVTSRGGVMLAFGLDCLEAVEGTAEAAATIPPEIIQGGTLVVCCGSGVTLAGLLRGLPAAPARVVGVSSGRSPTNLRRCLAKYLPQVPDTVELHPATLPYSLALSYPCPFPTHPHYDLKTWQYLETHLDHFESPILFWNVGA